MVLLLYEIRACSSYLLTCTNNCPSKQNKEQRNSDHRTWRECDLIHCLNFTLFLHSNCLLRYYGELRGGCGSVGRVGRLVIGRLVCRIYGHLEGSFKEMEYDAHNYCFLGIQSPETKEPYLRMSLSYVWRGWVQYHGVRHSRADKTNAGSTEGPPPPFFFYSTFSGHHGAGVRWEVLYYVVICSFT